MRNVAIFGCTGSIGRSALSVIRRFPDRLRVHTLAARGRRLRTLLDQVRKFRPKYLIVTDESRAAALNGHVPGGTRLLRGMRALTDVLEDSRPDVLLHGVVGAAGLPSALAAAKSGVTLAIANKESLVCAGGFLRRAAQKSGARLLPVDSEHNAIFQVMAGERPDSVRKILLTASGGPFFRRAGAFSRITPREALRHPNWKMGPKITVDSATLMNKALEIIEAKFLFDAPADRIGVVIHPESIVHSMVEFVDGSVKMQAAVPDMRLPIQYALFYPDRMASCVQRLDLARVGRLTFYEPDRRRFPSLAFAYRALELGGSAPAVMSAANEIAVTAFLEGRIRFDRIFDVVRRTLDLTKSFRASAIEDILEADRLTRLRATALAGKLSCTS
ncbi:MAG: 1-deoxy-D-xylulose-5-phosphate reductoisomerase [Candidatus Lindowbacteria bacterium RIFCSPLOWO2_12_FULL_62_27]|nr:MAG: 1-deoxy-D-xylulose-5-phosphate reductoisomerase [Candidatus Lindowbacteria bacterium RIFCSPLOWO2_12_FULL_62_27]OGH58186.1 MAG: 1-deoxy-D-xylulose-5-phosphate reductoisomerase [Candidatus Lindowbacteria bacterium RIFCSPLOWO2_02_FULL_62_12]